MFEEANNAERDPGLATMEAQAHSGFGEWVKSHIDGVISEIPYDPHNPHQWIDRVELEPHPSLEMARFWGEAAMGAENYHAVISQLENHDVVETVRRNSNRNLSTLIATLHMQSAFDTAITHNALFVAADDEEFANVNVVLCNFIMSRMSIGGLAVDSVLTYSGRELRDPPPAVERYIEPATVRFIRRLATPALKRALAEGIALHRAPSGTRAKRILLKNGSLAKMVPIVHESIVKTTVKRTPIGIGVPMDVRFGQSRAHVLAPRKLENDDDVHRLMVDMVEAVNALSNEKVFYGLPPGAVVVEE